MFVIFGEKLFGMVHQVPGVCYVATVFFHIFFFPIAPFRTYIVVHGSAPGIEEAVAQGTIRPSRFGFWVVRIPLSLLSVLIGYLRGLFGLIFVWAGSLAVLLPSADPKQVPIGSPQQLILSGIALGIAILFIVSRLLTRASEAKTAELVAKLGMTTTRKPTP